MQSPEDSILGIPWVEGRIVGEDLAGVDDIIGLCVFDVGILAVKSECFLN